MRLLVLADLHLRGSSKALEKSVRRVVHEENPDVIVICGDVFESGTSNPYGRLSEFGRKTVFCLGNHEFIGRTVEETVRRYEEMQERSGDGICCLDVLGHVDIGGVRFIGNVLWYDGSLSDREDRGELMARIEPGWIDSMIVGFNPEMECRKCAGRIADSLSGWDGSSVLVTHMVPHRSVNSFSVDSPESAYNAYSGMNDLFSLLPSAPSMAFCGHTHRKCMAVAEGVSSVSGRPFRVPCVNVGNDYFSRSARLEYVIAEI